MRSSLDHLPAGKRHELAFVVEVLSESFAAALATRESADARDGHILKIILFGSYARGDWVEDPVGRYFSDYDFLVVVDHERLTDMLDVWEGAEKRLISALSSGARLRTPVNIIVHTMTEVNYQLARGRYFFVDIVRDGIVLLELPDQPFVEPAAIAPETSLAEASAFLEDGLSNFTEYYGSAMHSLSQKWYKKTAFDLHQSAERLYTCLLLVMTLYTPKSHNLVRLRKLAEHLDDRLTDVWPTSTKFEKRCFELLRAAYVKARYSRHYQIAEEELDWVASRVELLRALVQEICEARLSELRGKLGPGPA